MFKTKAKGKTEIPSAPVKETVVANAPSEEKTSAEESVAFIAGTPSIGLQFKDWLYYTKNKTATDAVVEMIEAEIKGMPVQIKWNEWAKAFNTVLDKFVLEGKVVVAHYPVTCCPVGGKKYEIEIEGYCTSQEKVSGFVGGSPEEMTKERIKWYIQSAVEFYLSSSTKKVEEKQPIRYSRAVKAVIVDEIVNQVSALRPHCAAEFAVKIGTSEVYGGLEAGCQSGKLQAKCSGTETWTNAGWVRPIIGYEIAQN